MHLLSDLSETGNSRGKLHECSSVFMLFYTGLVQPRTLPPYLPFRKLVHYPRFLFLVQRDQ